MSETPRYSLRFNSGNIGFRASDTGEWVKWEDHRAVLAELARVMQERDDWQNKHRLQGEDHLRETRRMLSELEKTEASLAAVRAALGESEQELREEIANADAYMRSLNDDAIRAVADRLAALRLGKDGK
jgi:DNA repair ATPase RecN